MADDDINIGINYETKDALSALDKLEAETKKSTSSIEKTFGSLKVAAAAAVAVFASKEILEFFSKSIEEAAAADEAVQGLNFALAASGSYSKEASTGLQEFASQIQETTIFTDDAAIASLTLAKNFGLSNDAAQELTKQAANLASVQKIDLGTATEQLLQSLNGQGRALKTLGPQFAGLTEDQLKSGEAIKLVGERFGDASKTLTGTFNGALAQAKNSFGEIYEAFGKSITQNEDVVIAIKAVGEAFKIMSDTFSKNQKGISSAFSVILKASAEVVDLLVNGFAIVATGFLELGKAAGRGASLVEAFFKAATGDFKGAKFALDDFSTSGNEFVRTLDGFETGLDKAAALTRKTADSIGTMTKDTKASDDAFAKASKSAAAYGQALGKSREEALKFTKELLLSSLDGIEKAAFARDEDLKKIAKYEKEHSLTHEEAEDARFEILKKFSKASNDVKEKELKEGIERLKRFAEEQKKLVEQAANNPFEFVINSIKLDNGALDELNNQIALGIGAIKSVLGGKEGAKDLVATAAGAIGDAVLPGIGPVIKEITKTLALGPDAVKQLVRDFVNEIPAIIEAIAESAPVFVEAFVDSMVNQGGAVKIAIAIARAMSGEASLKAIGKQIGSDASKEILNGFAVARDNIATGIKNGTAGIGNDIATAFKTSIAGAGNEVGAAIRSAITGAGGAFVDSLRGGILIAGDNFINQIIYAFKKVKEFGLSGISFDFSGMRDAIRDGFAGIPGALADAIKEALSGIGGGILGGGGGAGGTLGRVILAGATGGTSEVIRAAGVNFAEGGVVPKGFPNDTYSGVNLTSDERVLSPIRNDRFERLLDKLDQQTSGGGSGGGMTQVILKIGESELAKVMLNLNRQGFRTA